MEASNLSTLSRRTIILLHAVHWLLKWQDRCYRASRELSSNYLFCFASIHLAFTLCISACRRAYSHASLLCNGVHADVTFSAKQKVNCACRTNRLGQLSLPSLRGG